MTMLLRWTFALLVALAALPAMQSRAAAPEDTAEATVPAADPFGRDTPRGAVTGLIDALAAQDYIRAGAYFDLPEGEASAGAETPAAELARQFQAVLDRGGTLDAFVVLSNEATGRLDDGLPADVERVGAFGGEDGGPILLARSEGPDGAPVWRISQETIDDLARLEPPAAEPDTAGETTQGLVVAGAPLDDWAFLLGIAIANFFAFWAIAAIILAVMRGVIGDREKSTLYRLTHAALPPVSLMLAVLSFQLWADSVAASIVARQTLLRYIGIVGWIALAWFALRLIDAVTGIATARMALRERRQAVSVITLARRAAKIALLALAIVGILDTLGFDVTAGVAALGISGIALALGAQKTVENLVGGVSVIADQPLQVGDFCRVGDVVGTVEDIGMRSTRLRTLERSIVTIPNSDLSSREIENFDKRDRFLFNPTIGVEYGISAAKLREGVELIEQVLIDNPQVEKDGARARFANFGDSSLDIEVWSYIAVPDFTESRLVRQELLLEIFARLEAAGLTIAFPTRTVHLVQDGPGAPVAGATAETRAEDRPETVVPAGDERQGGPVAPPPG
ncbi:MAG: mechanosensitive ion channel family protein [Porphyrobacter sp.]|nr:mechanosensitive ion channel family protein [Porphyrobacter sp.]